VRIGVELGANGRGVGVGCGVELLGEVLKLDVEFNCCCEMRC
jgi:hypothetical protein